MSGKDFQVRYYEKEMPEINDVVMVKVESMTDNSCYVRLLEYNNIEGMIPYTELSRRRIRSITQLAKVGRLQVAVVIRLDKEKKYIDLSKKQVTADERRLCEERFRKAKAVTGIMCTAAMEMKVPPMTLMKAVAFPLYKQGVAYDALKLAVSQPEAVLTPLNLPAEMYQRVAAIVQHKLRAEMLKIQADVNVTCFTPAGVDAIRDVLMLGQQEGSPSVNMSVLAPPTYVMYLMTDDKEEGVRKLWECINAMQAEMKIRGGNVETPMPPRVIGSDGADGAVAPAGSSSDDEDGTD